MQGEQSVFPTRLPATLEESIKLNIHQHDEIQQLKHELAQIKRLIFAQKSERFVPKDAPVEQTELDGLFEGMSQRPGFAESKERITYERRKPKGHGRNPIPEDLYTEEIVVDLTDEEKKCAHCGTEKTCIGQDETTELEYKPAVFFAKKYIRPKYVCKGCPDSGVATAALPARPIDKGIAGPGLIAYILVSKYVDHLPLYRLEQIFKRYNIHINRSTMVGWIAQVTVWLQALYDELHRSLLESLYVHSDETPLRVLDDEKKGKCHLGYLWPYLGNNNIALFDYCDGRGRAGPIDFLENYKGSYLMSDGYAGYNELVKRKNLVHLMCWAHVRRNFYEAKDLEPQFIGVVLDLIKKLYEIERRSKEENLNTQGIYNLRQEESKPVLEEIEHVLKNPGKVLLPKNPVSQAIAYALNHWIELTGYIENGILPIDNNLCENIIRPVALGRKNWLFAGSHEGARRMAIIYSLMATCKLNGVEPFEYFNNVLSRIADYPASKIRDLTPTQWKIDKDKSVDKVG